MANDAKPDWNFEPPRSPYATDAFPAEPVVSRAPIDGRGRVVRQDWAHETPTRNDPPFPDAPVEPSGDKPTFTAEDLAHIDSSDFEVEEAPASAPAGADPLADIPAEDVAGWRRQLENGFRTPEELQKAYNLTDAERAALQQPAPKPMTLTRVARELAAIEKQMRDDPRGYRKDGGAERHLELLRLQEKLTAGTPPETEAETPEERAEVVTKLDQGLVAEWSKQGSVDYHLGVARNTVQAMREALAPDDAASLQTSFDTLPASVQTAVFRYLAIDGAGSSRAASAEEVEGFAETCPEAADVVKGWGSRAAERFGQARGRMETILGSMPAEDRDTALAWLAGLNDQQEAAVVAALAG